MTIVDDLTPVHYQLNRIRFHRQGADVIAIADLQILNAAGDRIAADHPLTTLTQAEKQALQAFVTRELAAYETATGLTEWQD
jgi:hypothetical protein